MAGHRRHRRYAGDAYSRDIGRERALQHIEDARRLTAELGGMDQDVKAYFFSLPPADLELLFVEYGKLHNNGRSDDQSPEAYARATFSKWRSGSVKMSGKVAERLFNLLPPRMPVAKKYELAEGLWHHVGPQSQRTMRIGIDATVDEVVEQVRNHIQEVVTSYRIPDTLERRFAWLAGGDVGIKQDLLNHLRNMEKELVVQAARVQAPILLEHLRTDTARYTTRLAQILKIGKHELELVLDRDAAGVRLETPEETRRANYAASAGSSGSSLWWLWLVAAAIGIWLLSRL